MSYSQSTEESVILEHCPATGTFLDIGAYDPRVFSNTRALYERGWSGVMVEPSPEPFLNLLREYGNDPRIRLINAAVTARVGHVRPLLKLFATADALSTTLETLRDRWGQNGGFYGSFLCADVSLEQILCLLDTAVRFVSIDTEGHSVEIFRRLVELAGPHCVCVEHEDRKSDILAAAPRYRVVHETTENLILVRS